MNELPLNALSVPCATCRAYCHQPCRNPDTHALTLKPHPVRKQDATLIRWGFPRQKWYETTRPTESRADTSNQSGRRAARIWVDSSGGDA